MLRYSLPAATVVALESVELPPHAARSVDSASAPPPARKPRRDRPPKPNVPIRVVAGRVPITHGERALPARDRTSICRCGAPRCQPLCDGSHKAIAIEPSGQNYPKLANNARINGNRFEAMKCAIGAARGTARLSGTKHEAFSIAGDQSDGEEVPVLALDNLLDDGKVSSAGKFLVKLDVDGFEVDFYGSMDDGINSGDPTDRLFAWWRLDSPRVYAASAGRIEPIDPVDLIVTGRDAIEIELPDDIVALRATDPDAAAQWRIAVREAFVAAFADGFRIIGVSATGGYVLERQP